MFDPKMVEAVARALLDRMPFHSPWEDQYPGVQRRFREDATAALAALCAHLNLPPEALNALAKGEAVVVPREMNEAEWNSAAIKMDAHPQSLFAERIRKMWPVVCAASPYAPKEGGDGG